MRGTASTRPPARGPSRSRMRRAPAIAGWQKATRARSQAAVGQPHKPGTDSCAATGAHVGRKRVATVPARDAVIQLVQAVLLPCERVRRGYRQASLPPSPASEGRCFSGIRPHSRHCRDHRCPVTARDLGGGRQSGENHTSGGICRRLHAAQFVVRTNLRPSTHADFRPVPRCRDRGARRGQPHPH